MDDERIVVAEREEPDFAGRWGLFMPAEQRWLDLVFDSQKEAVEGIRVLRAAGLVQALAA
ncbi:MAG: hypothetical protein ACRYFW_02850 [Janthinobacterium lividum]